MSAVLKLRAVAPVPASLSHLENLDAGVVFFGHGEPWQDGVAVAVESARRLGPS